MILNVQLTVHLRVSSVDFVNAKHPKVFGTEFYWALTWGQASPTFWPHWKKSVLSHTLNTLQHVITKISHNVLSNFMILCWAAFIDILSSRWDTPSGKMRPLGKVWGDGLGP